jgi:prophage endopeptidase
MTLYPALALAAVLAAGGFYKYGYSNGWDDRDTEMQLEVARKNEEAREKEQALAKVIAEKETELRKANDVVNKKQTDLNRLIAAGRVRLPAPSCAQAPAVAAPAPRDSDQARTEPDPAPNENSGPSESERQTLQLIAEIAADGDRAINQLNACIDAYENMRSTINGQQ